MSLLTTEVPSLQASPRGLGEKLATLLRGSKSRELRAMRHLETLSLGPKRALYLVECEGERFLVSGGGDALSAPVPLTQRFAMRAPATEQER